MRGNYYDLSCSLLKFLRFLTYKISITLLFSKEYMSWIELPQSAAKLQKICDNTLNM